MRVCLVAMSQSAKPFKKNAAFETNSYIGSEIGELSNDGERPPRTAKLVAQISWSWSPGHSRSATYLLSTTRKRNVWLLWERGSDYDTGKPMFAQVAWGAPYRGYSAKFAAKQLLAATWREEMNQGMCDLAQLKEAYVDRKGLVSNRDIELIMKSLSDELDKRLSE